VAEEKRVTCIVSKSIEWADTELHTIAVIVRGSPDIKLFSFKSSENKFYHFYTIKGLAAEAVGEGIGPNTCYLDFPQEIKISEECLFMIVTTYRGEVMVLRLPETISPVKNEEPPAESPAKSLVAPGAVVADPVAIIKTELDCV
jgi:hypothetical protein